MKTGVLSHKLIYSPYWREFIADYLRFMPGNSVNLTVMASPTAQQIPVVNPTKRESQWAQLQLYFL